MNKPRLIDANELIKCIEFWYESCSPRTDLRDMVICDTLDSVLQHIDDIPTAYDIDKVVEQLKDCKFWTEPTFDEDGYCNDDSWEVIDLDDAIEIVKGGVK